MTAPQRPASNSDAAKRRAARLEQIRQRILALPDVESCGHFSRDFYGNCWTCAREAEHREDMARAWDEGATKASPYGGGYLRSLLICNPYRSES